MTKCSYHVFGVHTKADIISFRPANQKIVQQNGKKGRNILTGNLRKSINNMRDKPWLHLKKLIYPLVPLRITCQRIILSFMFSQHILQSLFLLFRSNKVNLWHLLNVKIIKLATLRIDRR